MAQSFIAGWFGGVCVLSVCHPFDTVKVRVQGASFDNRNLVDLEEKLQDRAVRLAAAEQKKVPPPGLSSCVAENGWKQAAKNVITGNSCVREKFKTSASAFFPSARPLRTDFIRISARDTLQIASDIWKHEGLKGFYSGVAAPMSGVGFATAAQFGVYGYVSNLLSRMRYGGDVHNLSDHLQNVNNLDVMDKVVSATCGGVAYALIIAPFEMVKVRLQTQIYFDHRRYYGALSCGRILYKEGGLRKLYLGIDVMLLRDIIGSIVYFGSYGLLRQALPQGDARENIASTLFAGGCAGMTQWAIIFPLDTIKTRQQIAKKGTYIDWVHCGRCLYRKEGLQAFYYGLFPALFRAFIGNAICFGGVEAAMATMERLELFSDEAD